MPEREAGTRAGLVLLVVAAIVAVAGAVLLVVGLLGLRDADDRRAQSVVVHREATAIVRRTESIERGSDSPITKAETVASSVADIVDAGDEVIGKSAAASDVLGRAVGLANNGDLEGAKSIYQGEAATSVQQLQAELDRARAAQATAQQAVDDLLGTTG